MKNEVEIYNLIVFGKETKFPRPIKLMSNGCIASATKRKGRNKPYGYDILKGRPIQFEGGIWSSSRLSFHLNVHEIPRVLEIKNAGWVLHHCDNNWCINPDHLYLGTAKQNSEDMYTRNKTVRENISKAKTGKKRKEFSFEHRLKMRISHTGKIRGPMPDWHKEKVSKGRKGIKASLETRARMSLARIGNNNRAKHNNERLAAKLFIGICLLEDYSRRLADGAPRDNCLQKYLLPKEEK